MPDQEEINQDAGQNQDTPPADPPENIDNPDNGDASDDKGEAEFEDDNAAPDKYNAGDAQDETPGNNNADDDDIDEDDEKAIKKVVSKELQSVTKELNDFKEERFKATVDKDLNKILTDNPEYKPYEARIRRFVNHENRIGLIKRGLPVNTVVLEAVAPYLQKIGAQKAKVADEKAKNLKTEGQQKGGTPTAKPDFKNMSVAEIEKIGELVKQGRYNNQASQ